MSLNIEIGEKIWCCGRYHTVKEFSADITETVLTVRDAVQVEWNFLEESVMRLSDGELCVRP